MATWKGRLPVSFTETLYDADIPYDSDIRYDGLIITNTSWTGRPESGDIISTYLVDSQLDRLIDSLGNYILGSNTMQKTSWTGRVIPN